MSLSKTIKDDLAEARELLGKVKEKLVNEEHYLLDKIHSVINRLEGNVDQVVQHTPTPEPETTPAPETQAAPETASS